MTAIQTGMLSALQQGYREPRIGEIYTTVLPDPVRDLRCDGGRYLYADYPAMVNMESSVIRNQTESFLYPYSEVTISGFLGNSTGADSVKHSNGVFIASYVRRNGTDSNNIRRSTNLGLNFSTLSNTAVFGASGVMVHDFDGSVDGKWMFVGGGARLAYSGDNGATFSQIVGNLPGSPTELLHVAAGPAAGQWIVSGRTASSNMFTTWFTDDNGATWSQPLSLPTVAGRSFIGHRGTSFLWDTKNNRWLVLFVDNTGLRVVYSSGGINPNAWTELFNPAWTYSASSISSSNTPNNLNIQPFIFANRLFFLNRDDTGFVKSRQITTLTLPSLYSATGLQGQQLIPLSSNSTDLGLDGQGPTDPAVFVNRPFVVGRMYFFDNCGNGTEVPPLRIATDLSGGVGTPYVSETWTDSSAINFRRSDSYWSPGVLVGSQYFRFGGNRRRIWDLTRLLTEFQTPDLRSDTPFQLNSGTNTQTRFGNYIRAK